MALPPYMHRFQWRRLIRECARGPKARKARERSYYPSSIAKNLGLRYLRADGLTPRPSAHGRRDGKPTPYLGVLRMIFMRLSKFRAVKSAAQCFRINRSIRPLAFAFLSAVSMTSLYAAPDLPR